MTWFDTHCHLDSEHNPSGADALLSRAREAGVSAFLCVGVGGMSQAEQALALAERHSDVYASAGVHPHDAARDGALDFSPLWAHPRLLAVGEVGSTTTTTIPRVRRRQRSFDATSRSRAVCTSR